MSDEAPPRSAWTHETAATAPWLAAARAQVAGALAADRLPHAVLIRGAAGLGGVALADWIARAALCDRPAQAPCGACTSCRLHGADTHPDLVRLGVRPDRQQIAIDDVRELIASLGLKSQRGGRRVAIVDPADAMSINGANALLKTLEEPGRGALLILTVSRPRRLPATIASRCQRLALVPPPAVESLAWLRARDAAVEWEPLLRLTAGAPLAAAELAVAGGAELVAEMAELPAALRRPDTDLVAAAERCATGLPAARLAWLERWLNDRIREGLGAAPPAPGRAPAPPGRAAGEAGHSPRMPGLPPPAGRRHIQALYRLLDDVRAAREALHGSVGVAALFERVLLGLADALVDPPAGRPARPADGRT